MHFLLLLSFEGLHSNHQKMDGEDQKQKPNDTGAKNTKKS